MTPLPILPPAGLITRLSELWIGFVIGWSTYALLNSSSIIEWSSSLTFLVYERYGMTTFLSNSEVG